MPLLLVFAILIAFVVPQTPLRLAAPPSFLACVAGLTMTLVVVIAAGAARVISSLLRDDPRRRPAILRGYRWLLRLHSALLVIAYAAVIHLFGWNRIVAEHWGLANAVLLDELLVLVPFLVPLIASWALFYDIDCALRASGNPNGDSPPAPWSRSEYVGFHVRHQLALLLVPLAFLVAVQDTLRLALPGDELSVMQNTLLLLAGAGVLFLFPVLVRVLWKAQPLSQGPLRDRLVAASERLGCPSDDILVWHTDQRIVNAVVVGFLPPFRYVLLSDGLIESLKAAEVEAVFGHEIGHLYHRHLFMRVLCLVAVGAALLGLYHLGTLTFEASRSFPFESWTLIGGQCLALLITLSTFALVFGLFARTLERQADLFSCRSLSCGRADCSEHGGPECSARLSDPLPEFLCPTSIKTFLSSLEKLADLNGIERSARSWQHPSIARRVDFLEQVYRDPKREQRFRRNLRRSIYSFIVLLSVVVCCQFALM